MKSLKYILVFVLILALGVGFTACKGEKTPSATESPEATEAPVTQAPEMTEAPIAPVAHKEISADALKEYTIVAPITAGMLYNEAVSLIYNSAIEKCGATLKMSDDFLMGDAKPSGKEIILGNADRDFVTDEFLAYDSYHIYFSGDNIVINGGSPSAIEAGAALLASLLTEGGLTMELDGYFKETELPLGNLKINGKNINEYKIVTKDKTYGAKYAAELLQKKLLELTGFELKIISGKSSVAICLDGTDSNDGQCHIQADGNLLTLFGTGMSGPHKAVNTLLELIGDNQDVVISEDISAPMFTLNNVKKKLEEGHLSVGFLGASVVAGDGGYRSLAEYFIDSMKLEYPDAEIRMKNRSEGGKNTMWGLYCLEEDLLEQGYTDLIFISLGGNDAPYGAGYDETALNYQSMIEKIRKNYPDTEIVFMYYGRKNNLEDIPKGRVTDAVKARVDISEYYGIPIIDTSLPLYNICMDGDFEENWVKYIYDTVHANEEGQKLYGSIVWNAIKAALDASDSSKAGDCYMPEEPLFPNSKKDAYLEKWNEFSQDVVFGTGEEIGWGRDGVVTKSGASISFDFEGIGLELGIKHNKTNPYFILIQIFDENGETVFEREWDSGYYYHTFLTNELEYGKYTVKLTTTKPSERYPSEGGQTFRITDRMIIK